MRAMMDKVCELPIPDRLLHFNAHQWKGRDETAALNRWREARRRWSSDHGWHTNEETRLLQEKRTAAQVLERRLAACTDPAEGAAAYRAYLDEHVLGLRAHRDAVWRRSA